ncbi:MULTISPECIES: hypothetical protein [unclassified Candidatus Tisiphia]
MREATLVATKQSKKTIGFGLLRRSNATPRNDGMDSVPQLSKVRRGSCF